MPRMHFDSLDALWHMAGHGPFVWSAYAIVFVVITALVANARARSKAALQQVRNRMDAGQQTDTRKE